MLRNDTFQAFFNFTYMQVYIFPEKITVLELCKGIWKYFSGFFNFTELEEGHLSDYSVR